MPSASWQLINFPEDSNTSFQKVREECNENIDLPKLAADLTLDAITDPPDLRDEPFLRLTPSRRRGPIVAKRERVNPV